MATAKTTPKTEQPRGADEPGVRTYTVLSRLDHDGESYSPGAEVVLSDEQAANLGADVIALQSDA